VKQRAVLDVSQLPEYGFDATSPMWWGTLGFMAIEGTGFVLAIGAYGYLAFINPHWPPAVAAPPLGPASWLLLVLLLSLYPNYKADQYARRRDPGKSRWLLVLMTVLGVLPLVIRGFELAALNVRWDSHAYGSIVWLLLGLHTVHLLTDVVDTAVLAVLMFTRHGHGKRFSDISDNAFYWYFVVASWVILYLVIYWMPRW